MGVFHDQPAKPNYDLKKSISTTHNRIGSNTIFNDFETAVFEAYPLLQEIKEKRLYAAGALYAAMTGSGSTIYRNI